MQAGRKNPAALPFWQAFPQFFLYPFRLQPLLRVFLLGLLAGVAGALPVILGWVVWLAWLVGVVRYSFFVLEDTAQGYIEEDNDFAPATRDPYLPYKQFVIFLVCLGIVGQISAFFGSHVAQLSLIVVCLMLPAQAMLLVLSGDIGQSLSPLRIWSIIRTMGFPYLGLCGTLFLLFSTQGVVLSQLLRIFPASLLPLLLGWVGGYFFVVMFRLMGYMLYQHHRTLGFEVKKPLPAPEAELASIEMASLLKAGQFDAAIQHLRDEIDSAPQRMSVHLKLHRLLSGIPEKHQEMLSHAKEGLMLALNGNDSEAAIVFLRAIIQHQPDFKPAEAAACLKLASWCHQARRYDLAINLLKGFDRHFNDPQRIPEAYLLGAKLLIDARRDEEQARKILNTLQSHYPTHPTRREVDQLLQTLDRLQTIPR